MHVSKRVIFTGRVQGVGFRYTTFGLARNYSVQGFVRNLANGTVELVLAGEESEIHGMIQAVSERMGDCISDQSETEYAGPVGKGFEIR